MITYYSYIKQAALFILTSSCAVGLVLSLVLAGTGGLTMSLNLDVDISALDGLWLTLLLPLVSLVVGILASPLSYLFFRFVKKTGAIGK